MLERNVVFKDFRGRKRVALVYPNAYSVGMSNLGFQTLYRLFNEMENVYCERFFLDFENSLETGSRLADFDLIAFSWQFELDAMNILEILHRSGIPLNRAERDKMVVVGGPCAVNPYPLREFVDVFFIGEAEANLAEFMEVFSSAGMAEDFANIDGLYVSKLDNPTKRVYMRNMDDYYPVAQIMSHEAAFGEAFLLEILRGCPRGCRFCVTGFTTGPRRERSLKMLKDVVEGGIKANEPGKISVIGPNASDHSKIEELLDFLSGKGLEVAVPSLRADAITEDIIASLVSTGQRSITMAPESGQRLRCVMNKRIDDGQFVDAAKLALGGGIENIKLYLMIGAPTETLKDIEEVVSFIGRLRTEAKGKYRLSVNPLVPKPHTPFQWLGFEHISSLNEKVKALKKCGLQVDVENFKEAFLQATIALGDERLSAVMEKALPYGKGPGAFRRAFKEEGLSFDHYVRGRDLDAPFLWDKIDVGVRKDVLKREYEKAFRGEQTTM